MLAFGQRRLTRTVEVVDFKENDNINIDLPLGYDINSVIIKLSGTITTGTAPTAYHEYAVPRLIDRIDIFSNGKDKFHEISGLMAVFGNYERKLYNNYTDIGAGTGAKTVECHYRIDFENADGIRPKDTNLHTNRPFMTKLQCKINTNGFKDLAKTLGSGAWSGHTLKLEVLVEETQEFMQEAYFEDRMVKRQSLIQETIDATKTQHRIKLSTGDLVTRGVKFYSLDENGALVNTVINSAQLKSGADVPYFASGADIRESNKAHYKINGSQLSDGFYYIDLCPDGQLNKLWDTRGLSELDLVLDVDKPAGGDATVIVCPVQFSFQDNSNLRAS